MKEVPKFEDFVKGKLQESDFPFKEDYWNFASEQIAQLKRTEQDKRKRRRIFWIFLSLFLIAATSLGWWIVKTAEIPNTIDDVEQNNTSVVEIPSLEKEKKAPNPANTESDQNRHSFSLETAKGAQKNTYQSSLDKEIINSSNRDSQKEKMAHSFLDSLYPGKTELLSKDKNDTSSKNEILSDNRIEPVRTVLKKETDVEKIGLPVFLPALTLDAVVSNEEKEDLKLDLNILEGKKTAPWSFALGIQFGLGKAFSSSLQETRNSEIHLYTNYRLARNWSISSGIGYGFLSGNIVSNTIEQNTFDFVATRTQHIWNLNSIHLLQFPLQITYLTSAMKHEFSLGAHAVLRLRTSGDLSIFQSNTLEQSPVESFRKGVDYGDALSLWNFETSLAYGYHFNYKMTGGFQYRQSLTDLLNDSFFGKTEKDRLGHFSIFLRYKL